MTPRPHLHRLAVAAAALAALGAAGAAPTASAAVSPLLFEREFVVELSAKSETSYEMPRHYGPQNCGGQEWTEATEHELITFRSRRPVRIGAVEALAGNVSFIRTDTDNIETGIPAGGSITRDSRWTRGETGGPCSSGRPGVTDIGDDCGEKMLGYAVRLNIVAGRMSLVPNHEDGVPEAQGSFWDCAVTGPSRADWGEVEARVDLKRLWHDDEPLVVKGKRTWSEPIGETIEGTTSTTISWSVTLKPVVHKTKHKVKKRKAKPTPKGKRKRR